MTEQRSLAQRYKWRITLSVLLFAFVGGVGYLSSGIEGLCTALGVIACTLVAIAISAKAASEWLSDD